MGETQARRREQVVFEAAGTENVGVVLEQLVGAGPTA